MLFYYSATGNSKWVVDQMQKQRRERVYSIITCCQKEEYTFPLQPNEQIGFVVPTYFYGIPITVIEFLKKLNIENQSRNYKYLILTCGLNTAAASKVFEKEFSEKLDAIFSLKLIDTYVPLHAIPSKSKQQEIWKKAQDTLQERIIKKIEKEARGDFNDLKGIFPTCMTRLLFPFYLKGRKTNQFYTEESCNGCGVCQKECIHSIIKIEKGKPTWTQEQCELCLKCLHACPKQALQYTKKTKNKGRLK